MVRIEPAEIMSGFIPDDWLFLDLAAKGSENTQNMLSYDSF